MKILATKQRLAPLPNIRVGYMKHYFFCAFLSLLLASCGGGGGSSSSSSGGKPCNVLNGKGKLNGTACAVTACNGGYDNGDKLGQCLETLMGYFSPPNSKERTKCPETAPDNAILVTTDTWGISHKHQCWTCEEGFIKNEGGDCVPPANGKFVDIEGEEKDCSSIGQGFDKFVPNKTGVISSTDCNFTCKSNNFKKNILAGTCDKVVNGNQKKPQSCIVTNGEGRTTWNNGSYGACQVVSCDPGYDNTKSSTQCQQTVSGFYSVSAAAVSIGTDIVRKKRSGKEQLKCLKPDNSIAVTAVGLSDPHSCYTCKPGYVKRMRGKGACVLPHRELYVNTSGEIAKCTRPKGKGFASFIKNASGKVGTPDACDFNCKPTFKKNEEFRTCDKQERVAELPKDRKLHESCTVPNARKGRKTLAGTGSDYGPCEVIACKPGYVKKEVKEEDDTCVEPAEGKYSDGDGELDCHAIGGQGGTFVVNTGAVSTNKGCNFSCNTGFVKNTASFTCSFPDTGKYVDSSGDEQSCNRPTGDSGGFDTFLANTRAVSSATGCGFSCNAGFVKDGADRECNYPTPGSYLNTSGAEVACTDITSTPNFNSWVSGAATDADSCPFSCSSGFTASGRMCREYKPKMLALGQDTSHVLFDNGEVEAWGSVSTYPWRTHIKKDLGSHTPQALVSGNRHRCIILENAGLKHGRLMCWGSNSVFYAGLLGVGDENDRDTPTAVTATVLGDAGDGIPNTVKSVAAGNSHSCAILSNDTVKCWGNKISGQIGGPAYTLGNNKIISGTEGSPLGSETASRIAVGDHYTCAVLSNNSVRCWGLNDYGQTGGGIPHSDRTISGSAGDPLNGGSASRIAAGYEHSCAILNNGTVKCWGHNYDDQTGDGTPSLGVGKTATHIAIGAWSKYTCTLLNDKTVKCWGDNSHGQIGGGIERSDRILRGSLGNPLGGQTAIQIAVGNEKHTCAIMESDNSVKCWGKNTHYDKIGFYGQIIGKVAMTGGSDGTGTSTGETATLTAASIPTATVLEADAGGQICKIELSGGILGSPWIAKEYTTSLTYNAGGSTTISDAIDNLITAIASPVNIAGTNVTLSKSGTDKIAATTDTAVFDGMTLTIYHDNDSGDCTTSPVGTPITLSGASGGAVATGLWVISEDYSYSVSGDKTVNLDSVHTDLGNTALSKEAIADKIVADVNGASWAGKQNKDLPYTATKLDGSSSSGDDCPASNFCVVFERVFKGTEGNYGIPFGDRDYEH